MRIQDYKGYELHIPTSGGKVGKGYNLTSNIQVRKRQGMRMRIEKQFRFIVKDSFSKARAISRAKKWIDNQIIGNHERGIENHRY